MTSLIKNQIIKRLSKFVKNLSSNQINLSALKGEGELWSINLDETALEELIELPKWLRIQKATCGRIFIKIPWTSLKTLPIQLQLDDVVVEIETCEQLRDFQSASSSSPLGVDPLLGKYGFTNRVIDGISLNITNVTLQIKSQVFKASIFLPSLEIYSTTADGRQVENLTLTRIRNAAKDHILLFKEISWPNARIEASSKDNTGLGAAIRLIANSCRIRIAMKKNLFDSSMVTSRVILQFDDLLSVVNDAQLNSALTTYKEITHLMKKASDQKKRYAGEKLNKLEKYQQPSAFQPKAPTTGTNFSQNYFPQEQSRDVFSRYDVVETSLHFNVKRLDLHVIADCESRSDRVVENGSIQITIANLSLDHYPYHEFGSSKRHWINYNEMQSSNRDIWASKLNDEWQEQLNTAKASAPSDESSVKFEKALRTNRIRMFESATVINIDDFVFYPVSLNNDKTQKRRRPLITSDKTFYQLPDSLGIVNIQISEYYYPLPYSFPVPNSDIYIQIMPIVVRLDFATCSWLDAFVSTLSLTIDKSGILETGDKPLPDFEHVAIQLEVTLPRIVISSEIFSKIRNSKDGKRSEQQLRAELFQHNEVSEHNDVDVLELSVARILLTNVRVERSSSRTQLDKHLELFEQNDFFRKGRWPFSNESTNRRISNIFEKHPYETYLYTNPLSQKIGIVNEATSVHEILHTYYTMTTNSLKKSAKCDIWHFQAETIYLEFTPASSSTTVRLAKQNMIDSLSICGWAVLEEKRDDKISDVKNVRTDSSSALWANLLCVIENGSMVKVSQKQYTFVMELVDELGLFLDVLQANKNRTDSIKQRQDFEKVSSRNFDFTVCLSIPKNLTLVVIDELQETFVHLSNTATTSSLSGSNDGSMVRETSEANVNNETTGSSLQIGSFGQIKSENFSSNSGSIGNLSKISSSRKIRTEENAQNPSYSSSTSFSEPNDETASQWDISEDLDADFESSLLINEFENQRTNKTVRLDLDEDRWSFNTKNNVTMTALDSANGVFVKLDQINICIQPEGNKQNRSMYVACNVKNLRLDEFNSIKFDTIKPKLFSNEKIEDCPSNDSPPIELRIDLVSGDPTPPPFVKIQIFDRFLSTSNRAIEILSKNLEEIQTYNRNGKSKEKKTVPIEILLKNFRISLKIFESNSTGENPIEPKTPIELKIEILRLIRTSDGILTIENEENRLESFPSSRSTESFDELTRQTEFLRSENEKLKNELKLHQTEINVLRGERDSLMKTISKLDIALTQAEFQRISQQESSIEKNSRKK